MCVSEVTLHAAQEQRLVWREVLCEALNIGRPKDVGGLKENCEAVG